MLNLCQLIYIIYKMKVYERVPFKRFILAFALFGENYGQIILRLKEYGYTASEDCMQRILTEAMNILPPKVKDKVNSNTPISIKEDKKWLEQLDVYDFCDFLMNRKDVDIEKPPYFKWYEHCIWILSNRDILGLVNIFLFNGESPGSISGIISYKYRKKISIDALELYRKIFWDTNSLSAQDVLKSAQWMKDNTLIMKTITTANTQSKGYKDEADDGSSVIPIFQDSNYIKWKIGYKKDIVVPGPNDFLDSVMKDSYFKYQEVMSMTQSIETEEDSGTNMEGAFSSNKVKRRNVEEMKLKQAKGWVDMFTRASGSKKVDIKEDDEVGFFKKMKVMPIDFETEKLAEVNEDMLKDIQADMDV